MKGSQHVLVNAGFIERFCEKETNYLFADRMQANELVKCVPHGTDLRVIAVPVIRSRGFIISTFKACLEFIYYLFIFAFAKLVKQDIFVLSSYAVLKRPIELLSTVFSIETSLVHHGELQAFRLCNKRYSKFVTEYFDKRRGRCLTDVFLSASIAQNVFNSITGKPPKWKVCLHPYPTTALNHRISTNSDLPVIGYFGSLNPDNRDRLQSIIHSLASRVGRLKFQDFRFHLMCPNPDKFDLSGVMSSLLIDTRIPISSEDYYSNVAQYDFLLMPYEKGQYDFVASGVAVDCLIYNVKYIVPMSDFFRDWKLEHPDSGVVYPEFKHMLNSIESDNVIFTVKYD